MDEKTMKQLIEVSALEAELQGMIAENKIREMNGNCLAYGEGDFQYIAHRMREVTNRTKTRP